LNSFLKYNVPSFVWAAIILWLSLSPGSGMPKVDIPHFDKAVHFVFYLILAVLMFYGWMKQDVFPALYRQAFIGIILIAVTYGVAIELMQESFTTNRHFEVMDVVADAGGAAVGSLLSVKLFK
jgi:VanZ family protein